MFQPVGRNVKDMKKRLRVMSTFIIITYDCIYSSIVVVCQKLIKLYNLNMYSLLYVTYTSIKLLQNNRAITLQMNSKINTTDFFNEKIHIH